MKEIKIFLFAAAAVAFTSCNDFLDATPDSRIDVDTESEIKAMLTSAYPSATFVRVTELASDNADDLNGTLNGNYDRFSEQCYRWQDITESDNENTAEIWQDYYAAIAAANHALAAMDKLGGATTDNLKALRGEALLCRAYAHFVLTNLFCQTYSKQHSSTDPGIPYTTSPETTLNPKYERGTVAGDYEKIEKDMLEGISLLSDAIYAVPRYHFNTKAAYTFASRFYLFYQQPDKVIEYATKALGDNPQAVMRDYDVMQTMPTDNMQPRSMQYASSSEKANFLLLPVYSTDQYYFSGYSTGARFNNNSYIGKAEEFFATPWAPSNESAMESQQLFKFYWFYSANYNKFMLPKQPVYFEETNANTHVGYTRTVVVALKSEEALLNRAEAYTITGQNAKALADINVWTGNFIADSVKYNTYKYDANWNYIYATAATNNVLTMKSIADWAKKYDYYRPERPLPRKHLHPDWINLTEGSDQENLLQCILLIRRLEFLHEGMRWFDIKRYGMQIYRREINTSLNSLQLTDSMSYRDPRQAIQIPFEVRGAGLKGNDRQTTATPSYAAWGKADNKVTFNLK
jgi:hypothetical protein